MLSLVSLSLSGLRPSLLLRRQRFGDEVRLCAISNAKSGRCPERCDFCAQSAAFATEAPVFPIKSARQIAVRIPGWVPPQAVRAGTKDRRLPPFWVGRYLVFAGVGPDEEITIEFPVTEETTEYTVPDGVQAQSESGTADQLPRTRYTCTFRGSTLVDISPRDDAGSTFPIYRRDRMRAGKAPIKEAERYVSPYTISW